MILSHLAKTITRVSRTQYTTRPSPVVSQTEETGEAGLTPVEGVLTVSIPL